MLVGDKKKAIVGGGPGGLTLARLLQMKGADVKVYERDFNAGVRVQGATLDLHQQSGLKAIKAAGLLDAFQASYRPGNDKGRVMDKHAHIIYDEHDQPTEEDFESDYFRPEIDRGPLRNMLLNSLAPGTVVWDSHLLSMSANGDGWKLEFKNGTTANADFVIGADGANSKIRPFVTAAKPFYSGCIILQGNVADAETVIPAIHKLLKGGKIYVFADDKFLHISSKGDGSLDFYISLKKEENWTQSSGINFGDRTQVIAWFQQDFSEWDGIWQQLIEKGSLPLLLRPQYCIPLDQSWIAKPNVTLLGDAAHIMPPSGEGVNLAMLDALELCESLTGKDFTDLQTAIAAYEQSMQARGLTEAHESLEMMQWMHSESASEKMVQMLSPME